MSSKLKILAISGSTRKHSTNELLLQALAGLLGDSCEVTFYKDLDKLPHFNPDVKEEDYSPSVKQLLLLIEQADGIVICTPEYVFALPGSLKNALEWTVGSTVFSYKPFAFIVASASGEKAFESLDLVMSTLLQYPIPENAKLLIRGGRAKIKEGSLIDEELMRDIQRVADALMDAVRKGST